MDFQYALRRISQCAAEMNSLYNEIVFNEWAVVSVVGEKIKVLKYSGNRTDFLERFFEDAGKLRAQLFSKHEPGTFEFNNTATGTGFESFVSLGNGLSLIWNHTGKSMDDIRKNPRWLGAQVPFVDLTNRFSVDPVASAAS